MSDVYIRMVNYILSNNKNCINIENIQKLTSNEAVTLLTYVKSDEMLEYLLSLGFNINIKNSDGNNVIFLLNKPNTYVPSKLIRFIKYGVDVNNLNTTGGNALFQTIYNMDYVLILVDKGINIHRINFSGENVLFYCNGNKRLFLYYIDHGIDFKIVSKLGENPLFKFISEYISNLPYIGDFSEFIEIISQRGFQINMMISDKNIIDYILYEDSIKDYILEENIQEILSKLEKKSDIKINAIRILLDKGAYLSDTNIKIMLKNYKTIDSFNIIIDTLKSAERKLSKDLIDEFQKNQIGRILYDIIVLLQKHDWIEYVSKLTPLKRQLSHFKKYKQHDEYTTQKIYIIIFNSYIKTICKSLSTNAIKILMYYIYGRVSLRRDNEGHYLFGGSLLLRKDSDELCNLFNSLIKTSSKKTFSKELETLDCKHVYYTSNEHFIKLYSTTKLRIISFSLFRPKIRNTDFKKYFYGALNYCRMAQSIFPKWVIRIYYDESLLTKKYKKYKEIDEQVIWSSLLEQLLHYPNVQLVKYSCPLFFREHHHIGYFSLLSRFLALFDADCECVAFRDIDTLPTLRDYYHLMRFIESPHDIAYYHMDSYTPPWLMCGALYNMKYNKIPAGMWMAKPAFPQQAWNDMINIAMNDENMMRCVEDNLFGLDEVILTYFVNTYGQNIYKINTYFIKNFISYETYSIYVDYIQAKQIFDEAYKKIYDEVVMRKSQFSGYLTFDRYSLETILILTLLNKYHLLDDIQFALFDDFLSDASDPIILPPIGSYGELIIPYKIRATIKR